MPKSETLRASRRNVLKGVGIATVGASLAPAGMALAQGTPAAPSAAKGPKLLEMEGKAKLIVLGDKPLNAETPAEMTDDDVTPIDKFFIRNNGLVPDAPADAKAWKIKIDGEVEKPMEITLGDLMSRFPNVSYKMMLECGGNGRSFFSPEARGNQWTNGGAGCAEWTGVRLADVLKAAGVKPSAVYTGHYGADPHLSGDASKPAISRGVPIAKAMEPHTLIVFKMNGKDLPLIHGGPVRLIVPGWAGSSSAKWLTRIWVRDKQHDGPGMGGFSYRLAKTPIVPGSKGDPKDTVILEAMPVRAVISFPADGARLASRKLDLRGHAWAGENEVKTVDISTDYGVTWKPAKVDAPPNKYAWQRFTASLDLPSAGYYEVWAKATDSKGVTQPFVAGNWNPQGYGGNPINRIRVLIAS
ncbi:MAG: molybdopterin containing oxidoreductase [Alphaproteobacteria bacterium RIFCSPHIGHO2_12_FULL_66_14]|nr:MAG: molybdopterin containing oxidoreductase [Alphaproteobacteria bacterium RIFCSPHIGHO2_12_FULL_66_14]